jgi:hypothetical protein
MLKARGTRPLSPVPTTGRANGADERTGTAVTAAATWQGFDSPAGYQGALGAAGGG